MSFNAYVFVMTVYETLQGRLLVCRNIKPFRISHSILCKWIHFHWKIISFVMINYVVFNVYSFPDKKLLKRRQRQGSTYLGSGGSCIVHRQAHWKSYGCKTQWSHCFSWRQTKQEEAILRLHIQFCLLLLSFNFE